MSKKKSAGASKWIDQDDAPELTREWFESADFYRGDQLIRRGRPRALAPKQATSIRLSPDVLTHFRATGPGWQSRIDDVLKAHIAQMGSSARRK